MFTPLGSLIRRTVEGRPFLEQALSEAHAKKEIYRQVEKLLPASIRLHCQTVRVEGTTLLLCVKDPLVAQEVRLNEKSLLNSLAETRSVFRVTKIICRVV